MGKAAAPPIPGQVVSLPPWADASVMAEPVCRSDGCACGRLSKTHDAENGNAPVTFTEEEGRGCTPSERTDPPILGQLVVCSTMPHPLPLNLSSNLHPMGTQVPWTWQYASTTSCWCHHRAVATWRTSAV